MLDSLWFRLQRPSGPRTGTSRTSSQFSPAEGSGHNSGSSSVLLQLWFCCNQPVCCARAARLALLYQLRAESVCCCKPRPPDTCYLADRSGVTWLIFTGSVEPIRQINWPIGCYRFIDSPDRLLLSALSAACQAANRKLLSDWWSLFLQTQLRDKRPSLILPIYNNSNNNILFDQKADIKLSKQTEHLDIIIVNVI